MKISPAAGFAFLVVSISPSLWAASAVPIVNPGFEEGLKGWGGAPELREVVSVAAHSGTSGLRINDDRTESGADVKSTPVDITPGKTYRLQFWGKSGEGDGCAVYLRFYKAGKQGQAEQVPTDGSNSVTIRGESDWREFSIEVPAPLESVWVEIWVHTAAPKIGVTDLDDFTLVEE